jgi:hypothetical protein
LIGPDGHVSERIELVCDDEDTAKERARSLVDGLDVELWEGARRIETYRRID